MADTKIELTVSSTDKNILENDLADINAWAQEMLAGKINKCWLRMQEEWTTKLMNDESFTDPIPSNKADFIALIVGRSDYLKAKDKASSM